VEASETKKGGHLFSGLGYGEHVQIAFAVTAVAYFSMRNLRAI